MIAENQARLDVLNLAQILLERGLLVRTWGNISERLDEERFVITPSGRAYVGMLPEDLSLCRVEHGEGEAGNRYRPSSEAPMHAIAYRLRPEIQTAIHTHQCFASAISLLKEAPACDAAAAAAFGNSVLPISAYGLPGTAKLHAQVEESLRGHEAFALLMARHGAFLLGQNPEECLSRAEALERFACRVFEEVCGLDASSRETIDWDSEEEAAYARQYVGEAPEEALSVSCDPLAALLTGGKLDPYLDDFAQICGVKVGRRRGHASARMVPEKKLVLCFGKDLADARNVRAVLEKNVRAALVAKACHAAPIAAWECHLMRFIYLKKYSRRAQA